MPTALASRLPTGGREVADRRRWRGRVAVEEEEEDVFACVCAGLQTEDGFCFSEVAFVKYSFYTHVFVCLREC